VASDFKCSGQALHMQAVYIIVPLSLSSTVGTGQYGGDVL